jgi:hypothetical protein
MVDSGIYARLRNVQMSAADRQIATEALHQAERIAYAILWMKEQVAALGNLFLKPSLKH